MKSTFKGFHSLTEEQVKASWKSKNTIFIFDTNVFLNLYGYAKQTRDDFFNILNKIDNKIWIPYQVGLEYQQRRLNVIKNEKDVFNDIEKNLNKVEKIFQNDFEKLALKRRFPKLHENTKKLEKEINHVISNYKKSVSHWNREQPGVRSHDKIREKINSFFDKKVGSKPENQEWLDNLYEAGKARFDKKIPPGFGDSNKSQNPDESHFSYDDLIYERQYGDLILWMQILEKAKENEIESVIFVTDDEKEDWWYKLDSNGKKTIGPLAALQAEIYREAKIKKFHMYSTSMFLKGGESNLEIKVEESSIKDANTHHRKKSQWLTYSNHMDVDKPTSKDEHKFTSADVDAILEWGKKSSSIKKVDKSYYDLLAEIIDEEEKNKYKFISDFYIKKKGDK